MDDERLFGPVFHELTFDAAIHARPPLLTDYQVAVIGVTDSELKQWAEEGRIVQTYDGAVTDARTLAAQIGLAKAMRKYNLKKVITFHSTVHKAKRFVDKSRPESLPNAIQHLDNAARPSGKLWTGHISGVLPPEPERPFFATSPVFPSGPAASSRIVPVWVKASMCRCLMASPSLTHASPLSISFRRLGE